MSIQGNFDGQEGRLRVDQALDNAITRTGNVANAQYFFFANGQNVGSFGQLTDGTDYVANFDVNYTAISPGFPASVPSQVTVQEGETLRSLAARIFGDASLWYVIAEENGLTNPDAVLETGAQLRIPNEVLSLSNNAATFKPFDVNEALGDTTPTQPPIGPKKKGCGVFGQILVLAIAIAVTVVTAGALAGPVASLTGTSVGLGGSLASIGANVILGNSSLGVIGSFLAGAAGGAVGSAVSQGVAIAADMQDEFSWDNVALAALSAGVSAGVGASSFEFLSVPEIRMATSNALTQGLAEWAGLQDSFDWKSLAIAAAAAPLSNSANRAISGVTGYQFTGTMGMVAAGITGSVVRQALGGRIDATTVLVDAFGNALGNSIVDRMRGGQLSGNSRTSSMDASLEQGFAETRAGIEADLSRIAMPTLDFNPDNSVINPGFALTADQQRVNLAGQASDGVAEIFNPNDFALPSTDLSGLIQATGPEPIEIMVEAQRLTRPQEQLYDRLTAPIWQLGYGMPESAAMSYVDRARENDIRYDNDVTAENNRIAINFGLTMVGGGAAGALGAALFPAVLASSKSVLLAGATSGLVSDLAFQGYQNTLFAGSGGDYGRSGIDRAELMLSAVAGGVPGLPAAVRGWADDLRGLGVPDWNIRLAQPGTLYSNGVGLELERIAGPADNQLIGSYAPSVELKYGTTLFGNEAHVAAGSILRNQLEARGVTGIIDRTGPGLTGVDLSVPREFEQLLGFRHIEIKPNTASGLRSFNRQVERWGYDPSTVRVVTYDANGNIQWGFDF